MSLFACIVALLTSFLLPFFFFFHPFYFVLSLLLGMYSLYFFCGEDLGGIRVRQAWGFWLFLLSEFLVFGTLWVTCFWFNSSSCVGLAYPYGIPLVETVFLVSSSMFISAYHNTLGVWYKKMYLFLSLFCALLFMWFALKEFATSPVSGVYHPHSAACFLTVGLHFSHVLVGGVLLSWLLWFEGAGKFSFFVRYSSDWMMIYWHFVDFMWLFVYTVVYLLV